MCQTPNANDVQQARNGVLTEEQLAVARTFGDLIAELYLTAVNDQIQSQTFDRQSRVGEGK